MGKKIKIKEKPIPEKDIVWVSAGTSIKIAGEIFHSLLDALRDSLK